MNHKILIAALAGLSMFAAAQSQGDKQKAHPSGQVSGGKMAHDDWQQTTAKPRDAASGQATGRRQHQPITITKEVDKASPRVANGDLNGDGVPDMAASKNSAHATESATSTASGSSNAQASSDAASGHATGKRQHDPMTVKKEVDKATPLLKQ